MASGTASAIVDGIITNITAASVLGTKSACTNYKVLETTGACSAVVGWSAHSSFPVTMGTTKEKQWTHTIELFVKDNSDPVTTMNRTIWLIDKVVASLDSDDTIQGTVDTILEIRANRAIGEAFTAGGHTWLQSIVEIDTTSYP